LYKKVGRTHFDEWWGPFRDELGWETMGDVVTKLSEVRI